MWSKFQLRLESDPTLLCFYFTLLENSRPRLPPIECKTQLSQSRNGLLFSHAAQEVWRVFTVKVR